MLGRKTALADLDQLEVVNTRPAPPDDHPARPLALRRPLRTAEHVWILNAKGNTQAHGWVIVPNGKVAGTWKLMVTHRLQVDKSWTEVKPHVIEESHHETQLKVTDYRFPEARRYRPAHYIDDAP